jgi:hypothetical protein
MARVRGLRRRDVRALGWKALVAEIGVGGATRFVMELHEGERDYAKLRGELFAGKTLDELYELQRTERRPGWQG